MLRRSNRCSLCGSAMRRLLDMPQFPLTEFYEPVAVEFTDRGYYDQAFIYCASCNHGQLESVIDPRILYGEGYRTRSGASIGSRVAIGNFSKFIIEHTDTSRRSVAIDIGGNDSSLLEALGFNVDRGVIVDPNASGDALLLREFIEDADLSQWKTAQKLILSSHTLEHIENPAAFMEKCFDAMSHDDVLAIQVPSIELLVEDARIEQIHHQHLHYYSLRSLSTLLARHGFEVYAHRFDYDHYGALMVLARKGSAYIRGDAVSESAISDAEITFKLAIESCAQALLGRRFVVFGAALMLPLFKYYLPELAVADYIADNDKTKNGLRYINLNLPIRSEYDLKGRDVLIGAINTKLACRDLVKQAFDKGARNVIVPTHLL